MVGFFVRMGAKYGPKVIKSVTPKLTKDESIAVKLHKLKMEIKKGTNKVSEAVTTEVDKFNKSLDKMKGPSDKK